MGENIKLIENIISQILQKENNFKKRGLSWYLETNDTIVLLELQKSNWGMQLYINIAVFLKVFNSISLPPKECQCHIRSRLSSLLDKKDNVILDGALDLENGNIFEERERIIKKYINEYALPVLNLFKSLQGTKKYVNNENSRNFLLSLKAKEYLDSIITS